MKQIPNLFTLLNLVFGCGAIMFTLQNGIMISGDAEGATWIDIPEKIWMASLFIGLAAVVDFLDGFLARLTGTSSDMGKQLDSLSDVVSFGVAPAMIIYQFLRLSFARESNALDTSLLWLMPAFAVPCAAAWRLARFNLDQAQSASFKGMPVPMTGLLVASFPLIYWNVQEPWVMDLLLNKWFWYGWILLLCWLMVSSLPLLSLKFKDYRVKNNLPKYLLLLFAVTAVLLLRWMAMPAILFAYVLLSLIFKNKQHDVHSANKSNAP